MRKIICLFCCLSVISLFGQNKSLPADYCEQLSLSVQHHLPLAVDRSRQLETLTGAKEVLYSTVLSKLKWTVEGFGRVKSAQSGGFVMTFPRLVGDRPVGSLDDPDYATYGQCRAVSHIGGKDWTAYNCIAMDIRADARGSDVVNLNFVLEDQIPHSLGAHLINIDNHQTNHVYFEINCLPRKYVQKLILYADMKGNDGTMSDSIRYEVSNLRLLQITRPNQETGWVPHDHYVSYSMSGYLPAYRKTAIVNQKDYPVDSFQLVDIKNHSVVFRAPLESLYTTLGNFGILDFTSFCQPGFYAIRLGQYLSPAFPISTHVFTNTTWRLLNFIFCQRCGYVVPGIHGRCHTDLFAVFRGDTLSYSGGWHDAGDLSQQTLQTAEVAHALLTLAVARRKSDPKLAACLQEEALWGLRFVLQCRLPDGYRASSMGLLHWTDGVKGTGDDIFTVRKQHNAFDNYLYSAYEAMAAMQLDSCREITSELKKQGIIDFQYAQEKYKNEGVDEFTIPMEHTYNTSASLFHAARSWAASQLYVLTHDARYAQVARSSARYIMACQEKRVGRPELRGFFYRDTTRQSIVHFIHQSRSELFMQALVSLCKTQPYAADYPQWQQAIRLYGNYLKALAVYTKPYDMAPSGTYMAHEYKDSIGFRKLHLWAPANADSLFRLQFSEGFRLDSIHAVRRFPICFSIFNGNEAVILSLGKSAALCGHYLSDRELLDIGLGQLYWTVGKNPFCQSLIYGEGYRYPSMDNFSSGEVTGEIPVGIRSYANTDKPYWPQVNNACYKEVWMTSAGKFLSLLSEY